MSRINWSSGARHDLQKIHSYIAKDALSHADRFIEQLVLSVDRLKAHPHSGRRVTESDLETIRELIFHNYRIIYRVEEDRV